MLPKLKTTIEVRSLSLPEDMLWLIKWTGASDKANGDQQPKFYDSYLEDLERESMSPLFQHLVVLENDAPRLFITVNIEANPYQEISGTRENYVWYLHTGIDAALQQLILPIRHALTCCFTFRGVERLFVMLDRHQQMLYPLVQAVGFEEVRFSKAQLPLGTLCYQYRKFFHT